ncbi:2-hydroxyacid dehydrogenase [Microbacterium nanhaiense]|uniref:2-hydroxyacid dehydrogenase n=1 Tax=Microbacterium nanhaiense TaxID=1301026 RepID=A0ABQ2N2A9_9MICO|nr:hydroxyacid dehydrogenase [Microbacterium nanhaiense]GGO64016.1 2-hydroxyacid dehydrogenase [Microbacterium nanhaiense]
MPRVIIAMRDEALAAQLFDDDARNRLAGVAEVVPGVMTDASDPRWDADLAECEVLLTGWGGPALDDAFLARAPKLTAVAHAAGTVKRIVTDASWARGVRVSSAADANGIPVAEYALAMILLAGKRVFDAQDFLRRERSLLWAPTGSFGNHRSTIGLVGASRIGRRVLELLRPFDHEVLLADPTLAPGEAAALGAALVPLDELLSRSRVVSLHAPLLDSTVGMIGSAQLALLPDGATLINTARGAIVDTEALVDELERGRIRAVLDVTDPEPLPSDHRLYDAPGVILTPHVAGALGNELARLGSHAVDEIVRLARGERFATEVAAHAVNGIA